MKGNLISISIFYRVLLSEKQPMQIFMYLETKKTKCTQMQKNTVPVEKYVITVKVSSIMLFVPVSSEYSFSWANEYKT